MTILVDMDDTIENLSVVWVDYLNKKYGTSVRYEDVKSYDLKLAFYCLSEAEIYSVLLEKELWETVKPLKNAPEYLEKLKNDGHKVYLLTATHPSNASMKYELVVKRYFPSVAYDEVIIASKKQMVKADVLIDDYPPNLIGGEYHGILFTANHNRDFDTAGNGLVRADNWEQVYQIINYWSRFGGSSK